MSKVHKPKTVDEYYDRLALGDDAYERKQREIEADVERQGREQEAVSNKTWGMGVNE